MRCPYCGNEIKPESKFCGYCGKTLVQSRLAPVGESGETKKKSKKGLSLLLFALLAVLVICLVLLCLQIFSGKDTGEEPQEQRETVAEVSTEEPTEAPTEELTEAPTEEPTEAPTEPPVILRHPLTGEVVDQLYTGRPVAVIVDNISLALPHYGISQADMLYEIESEGGVTRCLAIFTRLEGVEQIGPIRSARTYFNNVALAYNSPLFHCSTSPLARSGRYDAVGNAVDTWAHVDQQYDGTYFFRDQGRLNSGYATEHTLFTTGEGILNALADKQMNTVNETGTDYGLLFAETPVMGGAVANRVTVSFRGGKQTGFTYDPASRKYSAAEYGEPWMDAGNGQVLAFRNVLALYAPQQTVSDGSTLRSVYTLSGAGVGYLACDGRIVKIIWHRDSPYAPFYYTLEDGTPVTFGVGTTYVAVASDSCQIAYE